jgi:hypothetical protein
VEGVLGHATAIRVKACPHPARLVLQGGWQARSVPRRELSALPSSVVDLRGLVIIARRRAAPPSPSHSAPGLHRESPAQIWHPSTSTKLGSPGALSRTAARGFRHSATSLPCHGGQLELMQGVTGEGSSHQGFPRGGSRRRRRRGRRNARSSWNPWPPTRPRSRSPLRSHGARVKSHVKLSSRVSNLAQ